MGVCYCSAGAGVSAEQARVGAEGVARAVRALAQAARRGPRARAQREAHRTLQRRRDLHARRLYVTRKVRRL